MRASTTSSDRAHLARAVAVAEQAGTVSSPNPAVGCVIVRGDEVMAEAATSAVGGPHAEANALARAGEWARGATAYVTLEPCSHQGRTPACAPALLNAGVARVVYGLDDPNPLAGGGAETLRGAGVEVEGGVLAEWVSHQLEGFLTTVAARRPHVTLKLAQSVDGRLVLDGGGVDASAAERRWITGRAARTAVHRWRASVDAVLVGSGTVVADDPRLDVRLVPCPGPQPRAVVVDTRLRTPPGANLARPGTVILTGPAHDRAAAPVLRELGVEIHEVAATPDGRVDLAEALARLTQLGVTSVLAEPGLTLADALVSAGLVDRLVSHVALGVGDGPLRLPVGDPPGSTWETERVGGAGDDLLLHLVPKTHGPRPSPSEES